MNIGNRIKKIRKELDLTQAEFAAKIGSVQNTVTGYENGRRNPSAPVISLICERFNVREEWLRNGEGEMFKPRPTDILDQLAYKYHFSEADYVMVEKFVNLNPEARQTLFNYMKEVTASFASNDTNPYAPAYGSEPPTPMDAVLYSPQKHLGAPVQDAGAAVAQDKEFLQNFQNTLNPKTATKEEKLAAYQKFLDEQEKKQREAN